MTARITPGRRKEIREYSENRSDYYCDDTIHDMADELLDAFEATQRDLDTAEAALVQTHDELRGVRSDLYGKLRDLDTAREALEEIVNLWSPGSQSEIQTHKNAASDLARAALAKIGGVS